LSRLQCGLHLAVSFPNSDSSFLLDLIPILSTGRVLRTLPFARLFKFFVFFMFLGWRDPVEFPLFLLYVSGSLLEIVGP